MKTWNDDDDRDRKRPKEITVKLLADGQPCKDTLPLGLMHPGARPVHGLPGHNRRWCDRGISG